MRLLKKIILDKIINLFKLIIIRTNKDGFITDLVQKKKVRYDNRLIIQGQNNIDESAILIFHSNSKIILQGNVRIGRQVEIQPSEGKVIQIGYGTSIQDRNIILGDVIIGKYCLTAPNVYISSGRHYYDKYPDLYIKDQDFIVENDEYLKSIHSRKVIIEDDVWIGINSVIMSGVRIGRGAVVGANSVVTSNVAPFTVVAGTPARLLKKRLELQPKVRISFDNDSDLPNFYSGVSVDVHSLKQYRSLGGLLCSNNFVLLLKKTGTKINLVVINVSSQEVLIHYENQSYSIGPTGFHEISFYFSSNEYCTFQLNSPDSKAYNGMLLIKSAEVLNV